MFKKQFTSIDEICESDGPVEYRFTPDVINDQIVRKSLITKSLAPLKLGQERAKLCQEALIDSTYEPNGK